MELYCDGHRLDRNCNPTEAPSLLRSHAAVALRLPPPMVKEKKTARHYVGSCITQVRARAPKV